MARNPPVHQHVNLASNNSPVFQIGLCVYIHTSRARKQRSRGKSIYRGVAVRRERPRALFPFFFVALARQIHQRPRASARPAVVINGRFCLARAREIPMGRSCAAEPAFSASGIWFIPGRYGRDSPLSLSTDRNMERHTREAIIGRISRAFHPSSFSIAKARFGILEGLPEV